MVKGLVGEPLAPFASNAASSRRRWPASTCIPRRQVEVFGQDDAGGWGMDVMMGEVRAARVSRCALGGVEAGEETAWGNRIARGHENLGHEAVEEGADGNGAVGHEVAVEFDGAR